MKRGTGRHVLAAALTLTFLNAAKPLTMDDPSYVLHAQQAAAHPFDPHGNEMFTYQTYGPSIHNNAPPVSIYWLGLGMRLLGDRPFLWKLWLFPWALLLAFALNELLRRVAAGVETPMVWMTVLSPALLPGFNFMLDVPALALALAAVALFARAVDSGATRWTAVVAGICAGLAMQTKYTGVTAPAAILAYGLVTRRLKLAALAGGVAAFLFVGWELLMLARYGESPFLHYLGRRARGASGIARARLLRPFYRYVGTLGMALLPVGVVALSGSRRVVAGTVAGVAIALAALAGLPDAVVARLDQVNGGRLINLENLTLVLPGLAFLVVAAVVAWRVARRGESLDRFLLLWLAIELVSYLSVTTAPGSRRVYGVLVVLTLLIARLAAAHLARVPERLGLLRAAAAFGVLLGLGFWAVDFDNALAQQDDVRRVVTRIRQERERAGSRPATVWYVGNHFGGFQFYAPRAGLRPALTGHTMLRQGDWLVVPLFVQEKYLRLDRPHLEKVARLAPAFRLPITTREAYYGGINALRRPARDWVAAEIYRVTGDGIIVIEDLRPR